MARFVKGDPRINRAGRTSAAADIAETARDLSAEFPNAALSESRLLKTAASLLYRGEHCSNPDIAHKCITEARRIIAGLRRGRAVVAAARAPKLSGLPTVAELIITRDEEKRISSHPKGSGGARVRQPA
jgi:hypothetical protein